MEKDKFTIKDLDLFYGDFQALKKINPCISRKKRLLHLSDLPDAENPHC